MKKNGFTLVELIAVLVIISIIAVLATPNIINLMQSGKEKSLITDVEEMVSTATYMYKTQSVRGFEGSPFTQITGENKYYIEIKDIKGTIPDMDPYGYEYDKEGSTITFEEPDDSETTTRKIIVNIISCKQDNGNNICHYVCGDGSNLTTKNIQNESCN